ncbi:MAG: hypothetical protein F8N39_16170 [Clostridiaceae bacterium]|nr:hypothetical protein [Clostridiaceae bacterium]
MKNTKKIYTKIVVYMNVLIWIIGLVSVFLIDRARPPFESYLNRIKDLPVRKTWNMDLMSYAYYLFILMLIFSILSLLLNIVAYKKEKFRLSITPFFLGLCSIYGIIMYLTHF